MSRHNRQEKHRILASLTVVVVVLVLESGRATAKFAMQIIDDTGAWHGLDSPVGFAVDAAVAHHPLWLVVKAHRATLCLQWYTTRHPLRGGHHPRVDMTFPTKDGIMPGNLRRGVCEQDGF